MKIKRLTALFLVLALMVTVFAACGGDGGSSTSSKTDASTEESSNTDGSSASGDSGASEGRPTQATSPGIPLT